MSTLLEQITGLIETAATGMGFELVQVKLMDANKGKILQIMAQRPDGTMGVDDCARLSHQISAILDVEDAIAENYRLEVSSPGIDRPLIKLADYTKFAGHLAKIETALPIAGRKRFTGVIGAVTGEDVTLNVDNKDVTIPFADISAAKLVLTDRLIKEFQPKQAS